MEQSTLRKSKEALNELTEQAVNEGEHTLEQEQQELFPWLLPAKGQFTGKDTETEGKK